MTKKEEDLTVKNIVNAVKDINKLNKRGYNYIHVASGFIAHYSIAGFKDHYKRFSKFALLDVILCNKEANRWLNFRPGDQNFDYYAQKARIYGKIVKAIENIKTFKIPVSWSMQKDVTVIADTLEQAMEKANDNGTTDGGEYIDGSFEVAHIDTINELNNP